MLISGATSNWRIKLWQICSESPNSPRFLLYGILIVLCWMFVLMTPIIADKIPKNISAESDLSPRAKAIQDYVASDSDELSFKVQVFM